MAIKGKVRQIILLLGDWLLLYISLFLTLIIRHQHWPEPTIWQEHLAIFSWIFILWLLIFYIANLYNLNVLAKGPHFTERVLRTIATAAILSLIIFYLWPQARITPKTNLAIFTGVYILAFLAWRHLWRHNLRQALPHNNLLLIGYDQMAEELWQVLSTAPHLGYNPKLLFDYERPEQSVAKWEIISEPDKLMPAIINGHINTVVIAERYRSDSRLNQILFDLLPLKLTYLTLPHFYEQLTGKVPVNAIGQLWFLENLNLVDKRWYLALKRGGDVVIALLGFIISLPLWLIIAPLIKITSRGPIIFKQERIGQNNKPFIIYKFRTMKVEDNNFQPVSDHDKRITPLGHFLRRTRLDEIPQFINILKGEMSIIGPRPERPELVQTLARQIPFYHIRHLIKPGVTGWDQVSGEYHSPSLEDTYKKLQYDLYYLKHCSVYLDATIILKTIATVISRGGK